MSITSENGQATALATPTNDAAQDIGLCAPYIVEVSIQGSTALLMHRYSEAAVAEKVAAAKGSKSKKTDNVESYVWRDVDGHICIPGTYLVGSLTDPRNGAAKYQQDPRSPRKSALDLYRAAVVPMEDMVPIYSATTPTVPTATWDYLDSRRVMVQRSAITRVRPAFLAGWRATFRLQVLTPEYIGLSALLETLTTAGRLVGVGDFRPTFGRFQIVSFIEVDA